MITIDASIALAWYLEPQNPFAQAALDAVIDRGGAIPGNFESEVVHVLLVNERRQRSTAFQTLRALEELRDLTLLVTTPPLSLIADLARRHALSGYDAGYLAVAIERAAPLATLDQQLAEAARREHALWAGPQ